MKRLGRGLWIILIAVTIIAAVAAIIIGIGAGLGYAMWFIGYAIIKITGASTIDGFDCFFTGLFAIIGSCFLLHLAWVLGGGPKVSVRDIWPAIKEAWTEQKS